VILHGNGSNGKGVLSEIIFKVFRCKFGTPMVNSGDSKFMEDKGTKNESTNGATPELAKLRDCNIGIINETSEDMCFGEKFKKLNDNCEEISYRQLHKEAKTTRLITTFLMMTNHFPNFPIKDAFVRRTEPIPMRVSFVANPTLPHQKQKDESLFQRMTETPELVQGILNWFVDGAKLWYANREKLYELPACAKKEKQKYIDGNDWTLLFVVGEDNGCLKSDSMWLSDVVNTVNTNFSGLSLTNKSIIESMTERGATAPRAMNPHTKKKEHRFRYIKDKHSTEDADELVFQFTQ
jgi:phage/plasmid-associated DNA primase